MKNINTKDKIKKRIGTYVKTHFTKINPEDFILGEINYTHRCHLNAVQKVKEGKAAKVFSCVAIDKDDDAGVVVHFINQTKEGKFVDHTWGWMSQHYNYYLIKEIEDIEQNTIWKSLIYTKESLFNLHSNWFERLFANKDII
ncbi:hypothetical protein [Paenibacillus lactis]|uniref:hypothetical protein n=1 Tax=Paenibacillus lactis TaxID=228574 RepID=UPI003D759486